MEERFTHEQLAAWRKAYDWTQQEAAARLGLTPTRISGQGGRQTPYQQAGYEANWLHRLRRGQESEEEGNRLTPSSAVMIPYAQSEYVNCPTGLVLPKNLAEQRYTPRRPVMVELFCGCGGFGLGFIEAGFEVVAASDWDCDAAVTYMVNMCRYGEFTIHYIEESDQKRLEKYLSNAFKKGSCSGGPLAAGTGWISKQPHHVPGTKHFFLGDVRKLTGARILDAIGMKKSDVDCVTGGPPCQGYSRGGKQNVMDPRNSLVFEFARLILEIYPKTMVFENVPGIIDMVTPDGVPVVDALGRILEDGSFMTMDALKRTVEAQTGAVGLLRGGKGLKSKSKRRAKNDRQASLFDDEDYDDNEPME